MFASVILENQLERVKSVFKRMKIADTNSLGPSDPQMRYQTPNTFPGAAECCNYIAAYLKDGLLSSP